MPDIRAPEAIDAAWLTEALREGGVDAEVSSFTAKKVGTGQIGDCVRFTLEFARAAPDAPKTLVGKFPSAGAESRATGVALGNYHREVKFYQLLQKRARISTPHCYFTDVNEESHEFVLIMGDLAPAEQGDQLAGVSIEQARIVLGEAAKLHGAFWEDDTLNDYPWVSGTPNAPNAIPPELFAQLWTGFVDRYGDRVTPQARRIGEVLSGRMEAYEALRAGPRSLIHSDFRPDNMLFDPTGARAPVTVVDWQSFGYGPAAADIGYFIAGAIEPAVRRREEPSLLAFYRDALKEQGGGPYDDDVFIRHYVTGAYQHFLTAYFAAMVVTQTERGDAMFFKMLNGAVDLILDHRAEGWLD